MAERDGRNNSQSSLPLNILILPYFWVSLLPPTLSLTPRFEYPLPSFDEYAQMFPLLFQRYILEWENWFDHVFVLLSHLAAQIPVAKLWVTTMVLFENIME